MTYLRRYKNLLTANSIILLVATTQRLLALETDKLNYEALNLLKNEIGLFVFA